jgi:hypothetical protein
MKKSHLPLASAITLVAGLALLAGLGRIHGEQESAAASPASAFGPGVWTFLERSRPAG